MFKDVGKTIKNLATLLIILGILASVVAGVLYWERDVALAVLILVGGSVLSWLLNVLLYGFGELIHCTQRIADRLDVAEEAIVPPPHAGWTCQNCGTQNLLGDSRCKNCGKS